MSAIATHASKAPPLVAASTEIRRHLTRDGRTALLRPAQARDRSVYAAAVAALSRESMYQRFLSPMARLDERDLGRLMDLDPARQSVIFAFDDSAAGAVGVGVARTVYTDAATGDIAVTVADRWQGGGLGGALLDRIVQHAVDRRLTDLTAESLATNRAAIALLQSRSFRPDGGTGITRPWRLELQH